MDGRFLFMFHANIFFFPLQDKIFCLTLHPQTRNDGVIAQLVEQRTENPCVPGSIPGDTTKKAEYVLVLGFSFVSSILLCSSA